MDVEAIIDAARQFWTNADKVSGIAAALACFVAWLAWSTQRTHNRLSVVPIPYFSFGSGGGGFSITVTNDGTGPLRILSLRVRHSDGRVFDRLGKALSGRIHQLRSNVDGRCISPSSELNLLIMQELSETEEDQALTEFAELELVLEYTDVYGTTFPKFSKELSWFRDHR